MLLAAAPAAAQVAPVSAAPLQLTQPRQSGSGLYTYWGFDVYQASLWVEPGFDPQALSRQRYALELGYLRNFKGRDIAQRSIDEMRRQGGFTDAQAQDWLQAMAAVFPDISTGDRLTGVHLPGRGAQFFANGKPSGEIADPEFARLFFGIWLSDKTSAPKLRLTLLGQATNTR